MMLVDGGLINPVPIAPTLNDTAAWTFAVDLNARAEALPEPEQLPVEPRESRSRLHAAIAKFIDNVVQKNSSEDEPADDGDAYPGPFEIAYNAMDTMHTTIARLKLAAYAPRLVVGIPRNLCTIFEFHRARELINVGYERTERALETLVED
jgi:NTE family protein